MTADISRHSLRPGQKYTGIVHQQGRLPLDSDANEGIDLAALQLQEIIAGAICTKGSPDDGFMIMPPVANNPVDLDISAGSFFLGGKQCVTAGMSYRAQPDWLTFALDDAGPTVPGGGEERIDLIWLKAWEQVVTATEDAELLEPGLGGPDTTARRRMMCRVEVMEDVVDNCPDAFEQLVADKYPGGQLDPDGCAIVSNTTLTIGFTQIDPLDDLCSPSAQAGFLGARNEAFRIQVTEPGRFVWGRDNAAPLYRVQVTDDGEGRPRKLVFLTPPRDEFGWPLAGMTVELLRWGAVLDNMEKAAEPAGLFLSVANSYDPADDSRSIIVSEDIPGEWTDWFAGPEGQAAINPRDDDELNSYFYLRVWSGGGQPGAVDHAMNPGDDVDLGETGLKATFSGNGIAGDYWIVAARPNTPTSVTPWALLDGAPPAGPRRLLAPLALLRWVGNAPEEPQDCRNRFRTLCRIDGCCIVTVGDGTNSFGDFSSIQEAIRRLPDEGGEICIHAGEYEEHVIIENRRNITITGCGRNTRWHGEDGRTEPLLTIRNSSGIIVRRLTMTGTSGECIIAEDRPDVRPQGGASLADLLLEDLNLTAADFGAVAGRGGAGYNLRRCRVRVRNLSASLNDSESIGRAAAIFLAGGDLAVEHCRIEAEAVENRLRLPAGGIHIGGGSERVTIRDNIIRGGNSHGITFGTIRYVLPKAEEDGGDGASPGAGGFADPAVYTTNPAVAMREAAVYYGVALQVDPQGCIKWHGTVPNVTEDPDDLQAFPVSEGLMSNIRILRNEIAGMGYSGISALVFTGLGDEDGLEDAIAVESIQIVGNRIQGNMLNEIGPVDSDLRQFAGWGGIAFSVCSDATIRDNVISGNGSNSADPVAGIFLAVAEDVKIERNRIERNGRQPHSDIPLNPGRRGGIVIGLAIGGVSTYGTDPDIAGRGVDRPALLVSGNVIDAPNARALKAITMGPVIVTGNRLTGAGRSALFSNIFRSLLTAGLSFSQIGGSIINPRADIDTSNYPDLELLSDVLGGDVVNLISLAVAEEFFISRGKGEDYAPQRMSGGEMMVNDNQISLQCHSSRSRINLSSVLLLGLDDISFCDNQAEVENSILFILTNVLAVGVTLRVSSNRLQKQLLGGFISAITLGLMNQTSLNQSTHCIFGIGPQQLRVVEANSVLVSLQFPELCSTLGGAAGILSNKYAAEKGLFVAV
jgi:hypothetical protein